MNESYTAVVKQDGAWWIGWIQEVPGVNCQEATRDELIAPLRITLAEALTMNRANARDARRTRLRGTCHPRVRRRGCAIAVPIIEHLL